MQDDSNAVSVLLRQPSGYLPLSMPAIALGVIAYVLAFYGSARPGDEGAAAHLFQILMAGQLPILAFFALKWLTKEQNAALLVLGMQVAAVALALLPVWALDW